jgi:hypothetical protein
VLCVHRRSSEERIILARPFQASRARNVESFRSVWRGPSPRASFDANWPILLAPEGFLGSCRQLTSLGRQKITRDDAGVLSAPRAHDAPRVGERRRARRALRAWVLSCARASSGDIIATSRNRARRRATAAGDRSVFIRMLHFSMSAMSCGRAASFFILINASKLTTESVPSGSAMSSERIGRS